MMSQKPEDLVRHLTQVQVADRWQMSVRTLERWRWLGQPSASRYADAAVFEHAARYHGGGFAGSGLLPDEVPIIARRGELVVPPERIVREQKTTDQRAPITVVVNVTAADASSFRASQGQIAADMARAVDRASRNR